MQSEDKSGQEIKPIEIPFLHGKINLSDLKPQLLLDAKELEDIITKHKKSEDGIVDYIETKDNDLTIIKRGDVYYAVYGRGKDDNKAKKNKNKILGRGGYGAVYLMQNLNDGTWSAVKFQQTWDSKKYKKKSDDPKYDARIWFKEEESHALRRLGQLVFTFVTDTEHVSVLPLEHGADLYQGVIRPNRKFNTIRWFDMALSGLLDLKRIHDAKMFHCDIKPMNMIFDPASHTIRFIDLGLAGAYDVNGEHVDVLKGTKNYMAPELLKHEKSGGPCEYTEKTEIYSMGLTLMEIFGWPKCLNITDPKLRKKVKKYLEQMISPDPHARPSLDDAIEYFKTVHNEQLRAPDLLNRVVCMDIVENKDFFAQLALLADDEYRRKVERMDSLERDINYQKKQLHEMQNEYVPPRTSISATNREIARLNKELEEIQLKIKPTEDRIKALGDIDSLKAANEVWLVLPEGAPIDQQELVKAKRALENLGIIVSSDANTATEVHKYALEREIKDKNIYICADFHKDQPITYPTQLSQRHFEIIIRTLESDRERLAKKLAEKKLKKPEKYQNDTRADDISSSIEMLHRQKASAEGITYDFVEKTLEDLQSKIYSKNKAAAYLEKKTEKLFDHSSLRFHHSTARKHIVQMRDDVKEMKKMLGVKSKGK